MYQNTEEYTGQSMTVTDEGIIYGSNRQRSLVYYEIQKKKWAGQWKICFFSR